MNTCCQYTSNPPTETSNYSSYQLHMTEAAHPQRADHTDVTERHIREEHGFCLQPTRNVSYSDLTVSDRWMWSSSTCAYLAFTSSLSYILLLILSSPPISCLKDLAELSFISSQWQDRGEMMLLVHWLLILCLYRFWFWLIMLALTSYDFE